MKARILFILLATMSVALGQSTKNLNQFTELPEAPNAADWIYLWDSSSNISKKLSPANLFKAMPAAGLSTVGGVKRNVGGAGEFVSGIDASGNLLYGTPAGSGGSISITGSRVPYGNGSGSLTSEAGFEYNATTNQLSVPNVGITEVRFGTNNITLSSPTPGVFYISEGSLTGDELAFDFSVDNAIRLFSGTNVGTVQFDGIDVIVPAEAYNEGTWNGSNEVPTKDAVRDKIEQIAGISYIESNEQIEDLADGSLSYPLTLEDGYVLEGAPIAAFTAMVGTTMDLSKYGEVYNATSSTSLAFSGAGVVGQKYRLKIQADATERVTTIPSSFNPSSNAYETEVTTPALGSSYLVFEKETDRWVVFGIDGPNGDVTAANTFDFDNRLIRSDGTGKGVQYSGVTLDDSNNISGINSMTIETIDATSINVDALVYGDGVKQTFNPNGTTAGINVGAHTADPSSLENGDIWYNSTSNQIKARINGSSVALGAAGSFTLELEGATVDDFEGQILTDDPTEDRTWTHPDASGYYALLDGGPISSTRVPFGFTNGTLSTDSVFTYNSGTDTLSVPNLTLSIGGSLGAATATTPAENDNDTSVATTAYVQTEIASLGGGGLSLSAYRSTPVIWDEMLYNGNFATTYKGGPFGLVAQINSTGAAVGAVDANLADNKTSGQVRIRSGTSANTSYGGLSTDSGGFMFNTTSPTAAYELEARVWFDTGNEQTASTDDYTFRFGFIDTQTNGAVVDGAWFEFGSGDTDWQIKTASNTSNVSTADTGSAVSEGTWYRLTISVNAAADSIRYYINGVEATGSPLTNTTNIPRTAARFTGIAIQMNKGAGATTADVIVDYLGLATTYGTSR